MQQRGLANCEKAVGLLREAVARNPDDAATQMELADALNAVMRIKTNANALVIDGSQDTPGNKQIWKSLGDEALPLAKQAHEAQPEDVKALAVYADSFMFSASSKGIVKQALSGTATEYKRVANELRKHPEWDGHVGNVFLGGLYNVAPWPVGDKQKARELLGEAATVAPTRRNLYYVGVNAFQLGDYDRAASFFEQALTADCGSDTERDFNDFMVGEARSGLQRAKAAQLADKSRSS
jgi:tetratricopeptide (TPR) repeat protein